MPQATPKPVALTVGVLDPSGGTGVLADLKTFAAHDCYGVAAVAAITAQNTREIRRLQPVDKDLLGLQIQTLLEDVEVAGIKLGLFGARAQMDAAAGCLAPHSQLPVVVDPVFRSPAGVDLLSGKDLAAFRQCMFPLARVLTPNAEEAGLLLGIPVSTLEEMKAAAKLLHEQGVRHVVITGGHLDKPADVYYEGQELEVFSGPRFESPSRHGIGCAFSSALLANLVHGKAVRESVVLAKAYVSQAIARGYPLGAGGARLLNHLFRFAEAPSRPAPVEVLQEEPHR